MILEPAQEGPPSAETVRDLFTTRRQSQKSGASMIDWADERVSELQALWAEGHSTAEIGRRMGISKNAVVGKAGRLQLPARLNPIHRADAIANAPVTANLVRTPTVTLPPLAAIDIPEALTAPLKLCPMQRDDEGCLWPIGEPGTKSFRSCGAQKETSRTPYCVEHREIAKGRPENCQAKETQPNRHEKRFSQL